MSSFGVPHFSRLRSSPRCVFTHALPLRFTHRAPLRLHTAHLCVLRTAHFYVHLLPLPLRTFTFTFCARLHTHTTRSHILHFTVTFTRLHFTHVPRLHTHHVYFVYTVPRTFCTFCLFRFCTFSPFHIFTFLHTFCTHHVFYLYPHGFPFYTALYYPLQVHTFTHCAFLCTRVHVPHYTRSPTFTRTHARTFTFAARAFARARFDFAARLPHFCTARAHVRARTHAPRAPRAGFCAHAFSRFAHPGCCLRAFTFCRARICVRLPHVPHAPHAPHLLFVYHVYRTRSRLHTHTLPARTFTRTRAGSRARLRITFYPTLLPSSTRFLYTRSTHLYHVPAAHVCVPTHTLLPVPTRYRTRAPRTFTFAAFAFRTFGARARTFRARSRARTFLHALFFAFLYLYVFTFAGFTHVLPLPHARLPPLPHWFRFTFVGSFVRFAFYRVPPVPHGSTLPLRFGSPPTPLRSHVCSHVPVHTFCTFTFSHVYLFICPRLPRSITFTHVPTFPRYSSTARSHLRSFAFPRLPHVHVSFWFT